MTNDRSPRTSQDREKQVRRTPWRPPSTLDAPKPPEGYTHRWIRESVMGHDDRKNLSARLREGFELVRADEYPDFEAPSIQDGKHAGVTVCPHIVSKQQLQQEQLLYCLKECLLFH